jgi:2-polyprenyl-3-methyl-5-hydroxy-6-metoxy-1,4-benzoquinol methylase
MSEKAAFEKYEFKPFFGSSHAWALNKIKNFESNSIILDVGPGKGDLSQYIKDHGNSNLHAIEIDPPTIKFLEDKKIYINIFQSIDSITELSFDSILLLDVLEHMPDPINFLNNIVEKLNPDGTILISVPNIAHWSIRLSLLFGYFEPAERGILDKTHLQYFTKRRILNCCNNFNNLSITEYKVSIEPLEFVLPSFITNTSFFNKARNIQEHIAQILPGLFGYQHLIMLKKNLK